MNQNELETINTQLRKNNIVAFIGAGVSCKYIDSLTGRVYEGLPLAKDLVKALSDKKTYINTEMSLEEACYIYKKKESSTDLKKFLVDQIDKKNISPLPAHYLLAKLPFNAYISMNFDTLMEQALAQHNKLPKSIISDEDIPLLQQYNVPVIKPHGCITIPKSIIVAHDEVEPFTQKFPLIDAYLKTILANKTVLFLGFSLSDPDFKVLYQQIKNALGNMMPKSYAIVYSYEEFQQLYWEGHNVQIIKSDLTEFLKKLQLFYNSDDLKDAIIFDDSRINLTNFDYISSLKNLASEVQIIDSFLEQLLDEIQGEVEINTIAFNFHEAAKIILKKRPSFVDFKELIEEILMLLKKKNRQKVEEKIEHLIEDRKKLSEKFKEKGKKFLKPNEKVLLLSQSTRVIQLLSGVPRRIQESCELYIAECRTKSTDFSPFQDALSLMEKLKDTSYKINFIPDTVIGHILSNKIVDKVLLGANTIFVNKGGNFCKFLNTSGSLIISNFCREYSIPLYIAAEESKKKLVDLIDSELFKESHEIKEIISSNPILINLISEGKKINALNITYDLVDKHRLTYLINEI